MACRRFDVKPPPETVTIYCLLGRWLQNLKSESNTNTSAFIHCNEFEFVMFTFCPGRDELIMWTSWVPESSQQSCPPQLHTPWPSTYKTFDKFHQYIHLKMPLQNGDNFVSIAMCWYCESVWNPDQICATLLRWHTHHWPSTGRIRRLTSYRQSVRSLSSLSVAVSLKLWRRLNPSYKGLNLVFMATNMPMKTSEDCCLQCAIWQNVSMYITSMHHGRWGRS